MWIWTIQKKLILASCVTSLMVVMSGAGVLNMLSRIESLTRSLHADVLVRLSATEAMESAWHDSYGQLQRLAGVDDPRELARLAQALRANRGRIAKATEEYRHKVTDEGSLVELAELGHVTEAYAQAEDELISAADSGNIARTRELIHTDLASRFLAVDHALRATRTSSMSEASSWDESVTKQINFTRGITVSAVVAIIILAIFGRLYVTRALAGAMKGLTVTAEAVSKGDFSRRVEVMRQDEFGMLATGFNQMIAELSGLVDQVQRSAIQVNTSVTQIGATANEQHASATEIAATTTQIGATSKEISATSRELLGMMGEVSQVAEQTASLAGGGQAGLVRMEDSMGHVSEAATSISAKLGVLSEKASNINQVITTITKVADQTNLLSLNAAIEAEKAGEAGRGFAVVATEIRRLADQTAVATYDIEQTVKEIQSAVAAGVMGMDKFSEQVRRSMGEVQQVRSQLSQIIQQVQALAPRVLAVNEGMQAQATGAEQISDALTQLTETSQQTVQSLRQSNDVIGGLTQVVNALRTSVSRFRLA